MNWEQVQGRWPGLIDSVKENWAKLAVNDLEQISGKRELLISKIEEVYGITKREADKQVWDWAKTVARTQKKIA